MRRWRQTVATLLGAAAAGCLFWFVPHFHRWTTGGYWAMIGLVLVAGVLVGLSQLRRQETSAASFLAACLPVVVAAGWVILAAQPQSNWVRDHVRTWSGSLGIDHAVHNLGEHVALLAFGLGVVLGLTFEPKLLRRRERKADTVTVAVPPLAVAPTAEETAILPPAAEEVDPDEPRLTAPRA